MMVILLAFPLAAALLALADVLATLLARQEEAGRAP